MTAARSSTQRSRRFRERERNGQVRLVIDVDEVAVATLLAHHGLLPHYGTDDRDALNAAWREFIARLIEADARQHQG
jgi:hypothetical protein